MESKPTPKANQLTEVVQGRAVTSAKTGETSLIARGLTAIRQDLTALSQSNDDFCYRQARDLYNRITDYGRREFFTDEAQKQLRELFTSFLDFANNGYEKAYFPLAGMYKDGAGVTTDSVKAEKYGHLALNWFLSNQSLEQCEVWEDAGWIYLNAGDDAHDFRTPVFWFRKAPEQL